MSHKENSTLLQLLGECAAACDHCATACLGEENVKMMARCIALDMDCAQICSLTAAFVARGSEHAAHLLAECAEICAACARECENHADRHDHCRECAEACRKCEEACRQNF